jgi:hypothetical protein
MFAQVRAAVDHLHLDRRAHAASSRPGSIFSMWTYRKSKALSAWPCSSPPSALSVAALHFASGSRQTERAACLWSSSARDEDQGHQSCGGLVLLVARSGLHRPK